MGSRGELETGIVKAIAETNQYRGGLQVLRQLLKRLDEKEEETTKSIDEASGLQQAECVEMTTEEFVEAVVEGDDANS